MANAFNCKCPERKKPVTKRNWFILTYKWNNSTFVRYGGESSDYSTVRCFSCRAVGRTKAAYVDKLQHGER